MKTHLFAILVVLAVLVLAACSPAAPAQDTPTPPTSATSPTFPGLPVATVTPGGPDQPVSATPGSSPAGNGSLPAYAPQPGDGRLARGKAYINSIDILQRETYPPQFVLRIGGTLPDPCHFFRAVVNAPDTQNSIQVDIYSVYETDKICTAVLVSFDESVALGSLPSGTYTVMVNERSAGTVIMP